MDREPCNIDGTPPLAATRGDGFCRCLQIIQNARCLNCTFGYAILCAQDDTFETSNAAGDSAIAVLGPKAKPPCAKPGAPFCAHKRAILGADGVFSVVVLDAGEMLRIVTLALELVYTLGMNVCAIITAAGRSSRYGEVDKLAQDLGGRSVLVRSVELFTKREEVRSIVVAGPPDSIDEFRSKYGATLGFHGARIVAGGKEHRWETVRNALNAADVIPAETTHVAVHDAARPGTSNELLDRVFRAAEKLPAVIPAVPINATIKRVSDETVDVGSNDDDALADLILGDAGRVSIPARKVVQTIDRNGLVEVQTPQVFEIGLLRRAYAQKNLSGATDDAELVERLGESVHTVEGDVRNLKITRPADLKLMRAILGVAPPAERPVHKRF
jgi:2-C-methyl-D-erythritol 4-phosphate cytidylyltransferase